VKKQIVSILIIVVISLSSVFGSISAKPVLANQLERGKTEQNLTNLSNSSTNQASGNYKSSVYSNVPQSAFAKQFAIPNSDFAKWDFNNTNEWSKFAYVEGSKTRLVVGLDNAHHDQVGDLERIVSNYDARVVDTVSISQDSKALVVELPLPSVSAFTGNIRPLSFVKYIEPDMKFQIQFTPNDLYWNMQWGPQKIQADWAWNTTLGNSSVLVAIVDTGIDYNHPDLSRNYVPSGYNWVANNSDPKDDFGHGTHVAGIIAAVTNNSEGIAGLAQVRIMAEKSFDASGMGYDDWIAEGIIHAAQKGAKIISMSFGGSDSQLIHDAIKAAYNNGSLFVAAAGNANTDVKMYPAAYPEVVSVAATDSFDDKASFSNFGDWIELSAPGVDVYSTLPTYEVTLNSYGYPMNYGSLSGTSMACPHVSGLAALVWSHYSTKTRDWLRLWLRYTADDIGALGFDVYYGYGRINARKALTETPPQHELIAYSFSTPPFIRNGTLTALNATVLNFGESNEANVTVALIANGTIVSSTSINQIAAGNSTQVSLLWNPNIQGIYNVTIHVNPVANETDTKDNALSKYLYVGTPITAVVLHSAGNEIGNIVANWQTLNNQWYLFGQKAVYIDYSTLDKADITYSDIAATEADVLIISCAYDPSFGWEFTDAEIAAITRYVHEGHGLIATAGTFYMGVPNNNKLAPLFGISQNVSWYATNSDLMNLVNTTHPLLNKIPNPFIFPLEGSAIPATGQWDKSVLDGGTYLAQGNSLESAIVTYKGLFYISTWLEIIPSYYHYPLQLVYNAITVSKYQRQQHDLEDSSQCPHYIRPGESAVINATVTNIGLSNETNIFLGLLINGTHVANTTIPELPVGASSTIQYRWTPTKGEYNVTAYSPPTQNENYVQDNRATKLVRVADPIINPIEGQTANYKFRASGGYISNETSQWTFQYARYISPYQINITLTTVDSSDYTQSSWMIVNTYTRIIEQDSGIGWTGMWYPGLVQTDISLGSQVSILSLNGTVIGSDIVTVKGRSIDCWKISLSLFYGFSYNFWYDKASGLWIAMQINTGSIYEDLKLEATNIPIGYAHDVAVVLNAPSITPPEQSTIINSTVYNYGRNNETNVSFQLEINGTTVASKVISSLNFNESYTLNTNWVPSIQGRYNVTAYVLPVPRENYSANNKVTEFIRVGPVKGHVLLDQTHGTDSISSYKMWMDRATSEGYAVDTLNGPITQAILQRYDVLVIPQATIPYSANETYAIQSFVSGGHGLLVFGSGNSFNYTDLTGFAHISWHFSPVNGGFATNITEHAITKGVSSVFFLDSVSTLSVVSPATTIIREWMGGNPVLAVSEINVGKVVAVPMVGVFNDSCIIYGDNLRLAANIIAWLAWKDTTPPSITITNPNNGTITKDSNLLISWAGNDNDSAISHYAVYRNNNLIDNNVTTTSYAFSGLSEGTYNFTVVAYDLSMNSNVDYVIVTVDTTSPSIKLANPINGSFVKGLILINATGTDKHFGQMTLYIDGISTANYTNEGNYAYAWNTTSSKNGQTILISLKGIDQAGNTAQVQVQVTVDNTPPIVEIMQPMNATYVQGLVSIQTYSYDQNLENTRIYVDQNLLHDWGNETQIHRCSWNTTTFAEGIHVITLTVADKAGNTLEENETVIVDNESPHVTIATPTASSNVNGTININFTATDTNMKTLLLYIDNAVYNITGQTSYSWDSQQVGDGPHTVKVVATDKTGNIGQAQIAVTTSNIQKNYISQIQALSQNMTRLQSNITALNNNNAALQKTVSQLQYIVIGVIAAAAVILGLGYIMSRRKSSATNQGHTPSSFSTNPPN
jgi:thermitase